ncbi:MAG: hypothetical protein ACRCZ0_11555 [Cetobacterium sp.]
MKSRKLRISEGDFREYLLDKYVDGLGKKLSVRYVWSQRDFMEHTGMFKINPITGGWERVSEGTISYYNKTLNLSEIDIFNYHQVFTKKIPETITFSEWSRINNKGYSREELINQDTVKRRMIKYFGLNEDYTHYSHDKVREICLRIVGKEALINFYTYLREGA